MCVGKTKNDLCPGWHFRLRNRFDGLTHKLIYELLYLLVIDRELLRKITVHRELNYTLKIKEWEGILRQDP
jgi:hypothetical protein